MLMKPATWPKTSFLLMAMLLLGGCVQYHPRPISAPQTLTAFEARSLDNPELKKYFKSLGRAPVWPLPAWDIDSLTLAAFFYHPDLDVARAQWGVAQAGQKSAGEKPNPNASAALGYNRTTPVAEVTPWIPAVALEIPVETAGKRGYRISQARHLAEAARLNILAVAWEVRGRLRRAFLDLFAARESESLYRTQEAIEVENVRILEAQLAVGEASVYEVTLARIALDQSRLRAMDAAEQSSKSLVQLAGTLGLSPRVLEDVVFRFDDFLEPRVDIPAREIRRRALLNRADILAALAEYRASQSALQLEIAKQYPDLNIGPGYELDQTDVKWTLGLNLLLSLFNRNRGPIAEAEARRSESAARFQVLQAEVIGKVEAAVAACRSAADRAEAATAMLAGLKKLEASSRERFQLGEISKLELLGSQLELAGNAISRLEALIKAQLAIADLEDAMQSPLGWEKLVLASPTRPPEKAQEQKK
jgi:outer membrane protein, heavy metal efflux system